MSFATHATTKKLEDHLKRIGAYQAVRNPNYSYDEREAAERKARLPPPRKTAGGNRKKNTTVANRKKSWMVTSESALSKPPVSKASLDTTDATSATDRIANEANRTKIMGQYAKERIPKGTELSFYEVVQARDISGLRHIPLKEPQSNFCIDIARLREGLKGYKHLSERAANVEVRCTLTNFTPAPMSTMPVDQAPLVPVAPETTAADLTQPEPIPIADAEAKDVVVADAEKETQVNPVVDDEELDRMLERKAKSNHADKNVIAKDDKPKSKKKKNGKVKKSDDKKKKAEAKALAFKADAPGCEITYFASRDIEAGEEIYTSFGSGYWMFQVLDQYPALLADRLVGVVSELVLQELQKPDIPLYHAYNVAAIIYAISNGTADIEEELKGVK